MTRWLFAVIWLAILFCLYFLLEAPPSMRLVACDVGQGDALLAIYGSEAILLDAGPNQAVLNCLRQKLPIGQFQIAAAVLSHWDADHVGGFSAVADHYRVNQVFVDPKDKETKSAVDTQEVIDQLGGGISPFPGDELVFPGGRLRFVWSSAAALAWNDSTEEPIDENGRSIGVSGVFRSFGFLGLGDLECQSELAVANLPLLIPTPILKVSHHGSKFSSCPEFLAKIRPEIGLVSVGSGNTYGHPAQSSLESLNGEGAVVLRTDQAGTWDITRDGEGWRLSSDRLLDALPITRRN